jgi:hypothetical protein
MHIIPRRQWAMVRLPRIIDTIRAIDADIYGLQETEGAEFFAIAASMPDHVGNQAYHADRNWSYWDVPNPRRLRNGVGILVRNTISIEFVETASLSNRDNICLVVQLSGSSTCGQESYVKEYQSIMFKAHDFSRDVGCSCRMLGGTPRFVTILVDGAATVVLIALLDQCGTVMLGPHFVRMRPNVSMMHIFFHLIQFRPLLLQQANCQYTLLNTCC